MREAINKFPKETFPRPAPTMPQKPVFAGNYFPDNQIHSILYYVDKKNPLGAPPARPENDSQFLNWETALLAWATQNASSLPSLSRAPTSSYGTISGLPAQAGMPPKVEILLPAQGFFVKTSVEISANITSSGRIEKANIYWNGVQLQGYSVGLDNSYFLKTTLYPPAAIIAPQNLLEIEAVDSMGISSKSSVIVYK